MTQNPAPSKIPIPLSRRLVFLRQGVGPLAVWVLALALALVLMGRQTVRPVASGYAEGREHPIAAVQEGRIARMLVELFDEVAAGQPLVLLDDATLRAELAVLRAEIERLRSEQGALAVEVAREDRGMERREFIDMRRLALDVSVARLDVLDRVTVREAQKADLQLARTVFERQRALLEQGIIDQSTFDEARFRMEALEVTLAESEVAISAAVDLVEDSSRRLEEISARTTGGPDLDLLLAPLAEAIRVQEARLAEVGARIDQLVLASPIDGIVSEVFLREGAVATPRGPILTITGTQAMRVLAWVDEATLGQLPVGTRVEMRTPGREARVIGGTIERIGPRIEEFPLRLQSHPLITRWGRPVLVTGFPADALLPGERVDLRVVMTPLSE